MAEERTALLDSRDVVKSFDAILNQVNEDTNILIKEGGMFSLLYHFLQLQPLKKRLIISIL